MNARIYKTLAAVITLALIIGISTGCGKPGGDRLSLEDIPRYPNVIEGESMAHSSPGGFVGGELLQFSTTDAFDEVLDFYTDALDAYAPEVTSHESELGRQTAFTMPQKKGVTTVVLQEFTSEGKVNISFMAVGS